MDWFWAISRELAKLHEEHKAGCRGQSQSLCVCEGGVEHRQGRHREGDRNGDREQCCPFSYSSFSSGEDLRNMGAVHIEGKWKVKGLSKGTILSILCSLLVVVISPSIEIQ